MSGNTDKMICSFSGVETHDNWRTTRKVEVKIHESYLTLNYANETKKINYDDLIDTHDVGYSEFSFVF